MSSSSSSSELAAALGKEDDDEVRKLVLERGCVESERLLLWGACLGVSGEEVRLREGPSVERGSLSMDLELLCQTNEAKLSQADVERVLVDYCDTQRVPYRTEMTDVVAPLLTVEGVTPSTCNQLLKAITQKYTPFISAPHASRLGEAEGSDANDVDTFNLLARLVLQYHDAALCSHLDRNKVDVGLLFASWLSSLFVNVYGSSSVHALWDAIFASKDALLPTYLSLALLTSKRDAFLQITGEDALNAQLAELSPAS
eukprot:gene9395-14572_t